MHPVLVRVRVFVPHIVELSLSLPHVTALSPSFSRLSLCFFRCAHSVQCSRLCILESRGDQGGDKTFMLNSKSISRVKTGSDGFIRPIAFLTSGDAFGSYTSAPPQPILLGSKATEQALRAQYGGAQPRREIWRSSFFPRFRQEIVREHHGYAPGEVSLRDATLVVRRSARLIASAIATVAL
ncbi:hypothetical protein EDB85DRAFT_2014066 [Lactarius pseudohatsudake]|nr:hypothetical protein EDB85DRAFT_2014066 [Lactarius pseudohatsudake]